MSKCFQTKIFLWEFPIGSYVKLGSAVVAILVGGLKCWMQFWKGTTQGSFQQFQTRRFFKNFIPTFFYFQFGGHLGLKSGSPDTILEGGHSTKVWLQLAQWFLRRRFLCEFPIGSYVKLSSAVGAILVEGPNRRTHFWKRTIQ